MPTGHFFNDLSSKNRLSSRATSLTFWISIQSKINVRSSFRLRRETLNFWWPWRCLTLNSPGWNPGLICKIWERRWASYLIWKTRLDSSAMEKIDYYFLAILEINTSEAPPSFPFSQLLKPKVGKSLWPESSLQTGWIHQSKPSFPSSLIFGVGSRLNSGGSPSNTRVS